MLDNDSSYADTIERVFYNGVMAGLSLDGKSFFYENPLEITLMNHFSNMYGTKRYPITQRLECFGCSCCPPNIVRFFPSVGGYAYGKEDDTVYVNLYMDSEVDFEGAKVKVATNYPKDGVIKVECDGVGTIKLRKPWWAKSFTVDCDYTLDDGYITVESPKSFVLTFDMPVRFVNASPKVKACTGKIAVMRGPVVYCAEGVDNGFNIFDFHAGDRENITLGDDYGGLPTITFDGYVCTEEEALYYFYGEESACKTEKATIKLVPYSTFANRGETDMSVWLNK
jgi:DUF1680 family protein